MGAIGLNPIRLDRIGLDPIRINAIKLGVPGASSGSDRPYIDPEVLASLKAVCICYGKSNDDPDRAVVKNLVDPDNPFVISNAAYKLNSGFGLYATDFTTWSRTSVTTVTDKSAVFHPTSKNQWLLSVPSGANIPALKLNVKGITDRNELAFQINSDEGNQTVILKNGINDIPSFTANNSSGIHTRSLNITDWGIYEVDQIPQFEGAFVTDGINDLITSTKTVQEMLGGSNDITVVSMTHQIESYNSNISYTNYIGNDNGWIRNNVTNIGKTGVYGYSYKNNATNINNILGDKNDYNTEGNLLGIDSVFSVVGRSDTVYSSKVAWYWTFIANRELTSDEINQIIAYYNLDKYVKPDIYYDVKKQGLSNDTPGADWYLKDFSGNGHDMQLYNFAKKLGSGIGKYKADYSTWTKMKGVTSTPFGFKITEEFSSNYWVLFLYNTVVPAHKIKVSGIPVGGNLIYGVTILENGINELPEMEVTGDRGFIINPGTTQLSDWIGLSVEQIPDYEGALVFDGVDDYGQFVGDLGLKDYTIAVDRAYVEAKPSQVPIISNATSLSDSTPFIMEYVNREMKVAFNSFGAYTTLSELNINRLISYQNTYKYGSTNITRGTSTDTGSGLTIGRKIGSTVNYCNIALWSLLLFPYTLSEFLIERQLKKHKLGTLYPDMVEFRPIVKSNLPYSSISYSVNPGEYISVDSMVTITVTLPNTSDKLMELSCNAISDISISGDNGVYEITGKIVKSPQKINLVISSYLTMLNNETLISNETLIKNE